MRSFVGQIEGGSYRPLDLARVLLVHGDLASLLALQTILQASGYFVDCAATPAEAISKMDESEYELVLSDGHERTGQDVLAYARVKDYRPATALINTGDTATRRISRKQEVAIYTENLPNLLGQVAELIGVRATRRYRPLRKAV